MRTRRHDLTNTNTNANTTLVNTCEHWDTHCMSNTWEQQSQPSLSSFNKERHGTAFAILAMLEIMFWRSPVGNRHIWKWGTGLRQNIPPRQNQPDSDKTLILFVREQNINKSIQTLKKNIIAWKYFGREKFTLQENYIYMYIIYRFCITEHCWKMGSQK